MDSHLSEDVKMAHWPDISTNLAKKHADYESGTYGVEIEFDALVAVGGKDKYNYVLENSSNSDLRSYIGRDRIFDSDYEDWLLEQRADANRYTRYEWDSSYGPPDESEWEDLNPEPDTAEEEEHDRWEDALREAKSEYAYWLRQDKDNYQEEFIESLGSDVFKYIDESSVDSIFEKIGGSERKRAIPLSIKTIQNWLIEQGEKLNDSGTEDSWNVGEDGMYVEIRSKHLVLSEFAIIEAIMNFVQENFIVSDDNSAHVHVGMPKDFSSFDLFVMTTLVDEGEVSNAVSAARKKRFEEWSNLRHVVEKRIDAVVKESLPDELKVHPSFMEQLQGKKFKISRKTFDGMIDKLASKFTGTNIASFKKHHTVEFRYFSSEMSNPRNLRTWIRYFMMLPVIAKKRNHARLGKYTFIRGDDYVTLVINKDKN